MSKNKWKNIAYNIIRRGGHDENDVEATAGSSGASSHQNTKGSRQGQNSNESVSMSRVKSHSLGASPANASDPGNGHPSKRDNSQNGTNKNTQGNSRAGGAAAALAVSNSPRTTAATRAENLDSQLHTLARLGDVNSCLLLLKKPNANINEKGKNEMTLLHLACANGHEELLKELLKLGANRLIKDGRGLLPVHHAAREGYLNCVKELLSESASEQLDAKCKLGRTPLMEAAESGCQDCCKILIGSNVNEVEKNQNTALHFATKREYKMIVKFLLENNATPNLANKTGVTPLHEAASKKSSDCLTMLFDKAQPDVFQHDHRGRNILHYSMTKNSTSCLDYLLEKPFVIEKVNESVGNVGTPLLYAIHIRAFDCITRLLAIEVPITDKTVGTYPLLKAASLRFSQICEKMLDLDSNILSQKDDENRTVLHMAALGGSVETVDIICNRMLYVRIGCISSQDKHGQTPLHLAAKKADEKVIRRLIRSNAAVGKQDENGLTALHVAAELGKVKCCELLVEKGPSNIHKFNKSGQFPLDLAFRHMEKNEETVIYLLKNASVECPKKILKMPKYVFYLMLMKCRMRKNMERAIAKKQRNIVEALLDSIFWEDSLFGFQSREPDNFKKLVEVYPDLASKVLGKCRVSVSSDETQYAFRPYENNYYMADYKDPFDEKSGKLKRKARMYENNVHRWCEEHPVKLMIAKNECYLLKHPVTVAWLKNKWHSYIKFIHYAIHFVDLLYLIALLCLMATTWNWTHIASTFKTNQEEFCSAANSTPKSEVILQFEDRVSPYHGFYYWVVITWIFKICMEIFYGVKVRHIYWSPEMLSHAIIVLTQMTLTAVLIFAPFGLCYHGYFGLLQTDLAWECGIFAVIFAWLHLINSLNQALSSEFLPIAKDFLEILLKVIYFLVTFVAIFAFVFHLLLLDQDAFASVHQSLASTIVWMLVDLGYTDTFVEKKLSYPILSNIIFFLFITTIGCLIVSLIAKERKVKSKGKELDLDYRRLVIYTRLVFRYDMCFPWLRRWFAVNKMVENNRNISIFEYYLGEIENEEVVTEDPISNQELHEQIRKLESSLSDISDQVLAIKRHIIKMENQDVSESA